MSNTWIGKSGFMITVCCFLVAAVLPGCAPRTYRYQSPVATGPTGIPPPKLERTVETVALPPVGIESEAEIGQSMVSKAKRRTTQMPVIRLEEPVDHHWQVGSWRLEVPATILRIWGTDDRGNYYEAISDPVLINPEGYRKRVKGGVFIPNDANAPAEVYYLVDEGKRHPVSEVHPRINYVVSTMEVEEWDKESFKRELVYSGISQRVVSLLYREFIDDFARPAFSQELRYDLAQGKVIGYKGARFEVVSANNIGIRYIVLKALD